MTERHPRERFIRALSKGDFTGWDTDPRDATGTVRHRLDMDGGLDAVAFVRKGGRCFSIRRRFDFSYVLNGLRDATPSYGSVILSGPYESLRLPVPASVLDSCRDWPLDVNGREWFAGAERLPVTAMSWGWDMGEARRLARLVRFGDMSALDGGRRFVLRSDLTVRVVGSFGDRTPEDLVMEVDHHPRSMSQMRLVGIPVPTDDGVAVEMGASSFEVPLGRRMMEALSSEYQVGVETTLRHLRENPVEGLPEGLGRAPPAGGQAGTIGRGPMRHATDLPLIDILRSVGMKRSLLGGGGFERDGWLLRPPADRPADPLLAQSLRSAPNLSFGPTGFGMSWTRDDLSDAVMNMPLGDRDVAHLLLLFANVKGVRPRLPQAVNGTDDGTAAPHDPVP